MVLNKTVLYFGANIRSLSVFILANTLLGLIFLWLMFLQYWLIIGILIWKKKGKNIKPKFIKSLNQFYKIFLTVKIVDKPFIFVSFKLKKD